MRTIIASLLIVSSPASYAYTCTSFAINTEGYLATAGHCVGEGKNFVVHISGKNYPAVLVAADLSHDVAVVKIDAKISNPYKLSTINQIGKNDFILGFPVPQYLGTSLKIHNINVIGEEKAEYIYKNGDVGVFPGDKLPGLNFIWVTRGLTCGGNSGGPLVDGFGLAVGITSYGTEGYSSCSYRGGMVKIVKLVELLEANYISYTIGDISTTSKTRSQIKEEGQTKIGRASCRERVYVLV